MALGNMLCYRIFSLVLVAGLCISISANERQQKLSEKFPREFKFDDTPTARITKTKNSSIETNQVPSQDGSSGSTIKRKSFTVWMKSLIHDDRGLTVYNAGNLIYRVIHRHDSMHSKVVMLMDADGEVVFTIRRKSQYSFEGQERPGSSALGSQQGSFLVHIAPCNCVNPVEQSNLWVVVYNGNHYSFRPGIIKKSSNAKLEFRIADAKGKTIAELKQEYIEGRGVSPGRDMHKLEVESDVDVSFAVALVTVFGMMNDKI